MFLRALSPFLYEWLNANKILKKTEYIVFKGRSKCFGDIEVVLGGQKLNRSQNLKYLGVLINEHLNWKARISTLCSKPMEPCRKFTIMPLQTFFSTTIILYPVRTWGIPVSYGFKLKTPILIVFLSYRNVLFISCSFPLQVKGMKFSSKSFFFDILKLSLFLIL